MSDDRLKNTVLAHANQDASLTEQERLVVLAALESATDLDEVLGGAGPSSTLATRLESSAAADPVGAYLRSVSVRVFRGVGPGGDSATQARLGSGRHRPPQRLWQVDAGRGVGTRTDGT